MAHSLATAGATYAGAALTGRRAPAGRVAVRGSSLKVRAADATAEFDRWGGFSMSLMFLLMFVGGCAGSTTCGIKIFRFQVLYATAKAQMKRLIQPNGVFIPYYNHRPIPEAVSLSVMGFFFLFIASFAILAAGLGFLGLDFVTAVLRPAISVSKSCSMLLISFPGGSGSVFLNQSISGEAQ